MSVLSLIEVEFGCFPIFPGNKRASEMEIGSFGVVSKTFVMKRFSRNAAFSAEGRGMG
ncbi:hypothetical protein [Galbibacter pacificus]|uniref:Uncharacterized protein n=1 Tax=Galbibacter pacificus TaxID=2996052 RepID=A0ABT6FNS4_9FLAO|nr:hypothetical protein [Galbibacter pacificus]MDG3581443.1 hypothetical protein [Galbibacter pacificus]MDG3584921.1 hypothetical protein [Galbibacter pacificus]